MITYSRRFPYPGIKPGDTYVADYARFQTLEVPPITAFEADTPAEVEEVHAAVRDSLPNCDDWMTGNAAGQQSKLSETTDPKNVVVWSDGSYLHNIRPQTDTTPTSRWTLTTTYGSEIEVSVDQKKKLRPIYVRTYTHQARGKIRAATYVIPSMIRPWTSPEPLTANHRRGLVYLDCLCRAIIDVGTSKQKLHRLPIPKEKDKPRETLDSPGVSSYMDWVLYLLDFHPYDVVDKVLMAESDGFHAIGEHTYNGTGLRDRARQISTDLLGWQLLKIADKVL